MNTIKKQDEIRERIRENQEQRFSQYELVFIVVLIGSLVNVLSLFFYDRFLATNPSRDYFILIIFISIVGIVLFFTKRFFNSGSQVPILDFFFDLNSARYDGTGLERELVVKMNEVGLSSAEFEDVFRNFERALVKIMADEKQPSIGDRVIKTNREENEILVDISKNEVDAHLAVKVTPFSYHSVFDKIKEECPEITDVYLSIDGFINNSKHKNSLSFYNNFILTISQNISLYRLYLVLILAHHWKLIEENDHFYPLLSSFNLDE